MYIKFDFGKNLKIRKSVKMNIVEDCTHKEWYSIIDETLYSLAFENGKIDNISIEFKNSYPYQNVIEQKLFNKEYFNDFFSECINYQHTLYTIINDVTFNEELATAYHNLKTLQKALFIYRNNFNYLF